MAMNNLKKQTPWFPAFVLLIVVGSASAQITPSADAYTDTATPTKNYGATTLLFVDGAVDTTYIQFDLASIPAGADVSQATLKLYVNAVTTAGSFNVDYVNGTWAESTITSDLAPALGATIVSSVPITAADKNQYILINVTQAVQAWLNGSETNDGLALVANSTFNASFDSKENTATSHPAELDIVFTGGGTITGVTTASGSGLTGGGTTGTLDLTLTKACASSQVLQWNGSAWACSSAGTGTITGITAGTGLTGGGTSGGITLKVNTSTVPLLNAANKFVGNQAITGNLTDTGNITATGAIAGQTGTFSANSSNPVETITQSGTGQGLVVNASGAVYGTQSTAALLGVFATATAAGGDGVSGNSTGGVGVYGYDNATSGTSVGVTGQSTSSTGFGVVGELDNTTTSGVVAGVLGTSSAQYSDSGPGFGVVGQSPTMGVYGASSGVSNNGQEIIGGVNQLVGGVWGDTGANTNASYVGVLGTGDDNPAGFFENSSSDTAALIAYNGSTTSGAPVFLTEGGDNTSICTIDVNANLTCSGKISGAVDADDGARKVSVYAVQSPENWFEDFGSGTLSNGAARVALDPTFASTVNTTTDYHVFLTPKGDCKGLYVANETATGFEVQELGGGHSGVAFDYRIVAKRNGFESVRLADVTERYRKMDQKRQLRREQMAQRRAARAAAGPVQTARPQMSADRKPNNQ
jgi:hypothetical protein